MTKLNFRQIIKFYFFDKFPSCAGDAILRTLGGKQTKLNGEDIDYDHHGDPKNEGGLVAALHNQQKYVQAFQSYVKPAGK